MAIPIFKFNWLKVPQRTPDITWTFGTSGKSIAPKQVIECYEIFEVAPDVDDRMLSKNHKLLGIGPRLACQSLGKSKPGGFQTGAFPLFAGTVLIVSQPLSGLFLVNPLLNAWPSPSAKIWRGFLWCKFWRILPGIFLEDFSGHFSPTKMRRKIRQKDKSGGPTRKNPRKIRSAKSRHFVNAINSSASRNH